MIKEYALYKNRHAAEVDTHHLFELLRDVKYKTLGIEMVNVDITPECVDEMPFNADYIKGVFPAFVLRYLTHAGSKCTIFNIWIS